MLTSYILQEEEEAQAKADKIKLALEKLKEAKVKKVNYESLAGGCQINSFFIHLRVKQFTFKWDFPLSCIFFYLRTKINYSFHDINCSFVTDK